MPLSCWSKSCRRTARRPASYGNAVAIRRDRIFVAGSIRHDVSDRVVDREAPTLTSSVALPRLWPPNATLVPVGLSVDSNDNCNAAGSGVSVTVFSNEPDHDGAPGAFSPDAAEIAATSLRLRTERGASGSGRVYLIVSRASDEAGNIGLTATSASSRAAWAKRTWLP